MEILVKANSNRKHYLAQTFFFNCVAFGERTLGRGLNGLVGDDRRQDVTHLLLSANSPDHVASLYYIIIVYMEQ